jgi:hypothetical protein
VLSRATDGLETGVRYSQKSEKKLKFQLTRMHEIDDRITQTGVDDVGGRGTPSDF